MTEDFLLYSRIAELEKQVYNLSQQLQTALKDIEVLKQRLSDDDCR